jgi:anti-anti-sigma regulatory factor
MPRANKTAASRGRSRSRTPASAKGNSKAKAKPKKAAAAAFKTATLTLPENLDSAAAADVRDMFVARRGNALVVDASQVRRAGTQSLQVLISAARTWEADGKSYRVTDASTELLDTIALIGLSREDLQVEGMMQ